MKIYEALVDQIKKQKEINMLLELKKKKAEELKQIDYLLRKLIQR